MWEHGRQRRWSRGGPEARRLGRVRFSSFQCVDIAQAMTPFIRFARWLVRRWAMCVVVAAFTTVLFVQRSGRRLHLGLPYVYSTDEPHYLTGLNSVLWDGDAELSNNYARTNWGHVDTGILRAGQLIDHHTYLPSFVGTVYPHSSLFGSFGVRADHDASGRRRPPVLRFPADGALPLEYSWHPTYPFFLVAPLLSLLPRTAVEPVLLCLLSALTGLAAWRFRELCTTLVPSGLYADLAMVGVFVGTPVLYYSRALFPECFFVILTVVACHAVMVRGRWFVAGLCFMLAAALKPPAALLAVPALLLLWRRDIRKSLLTFALVCVGVGFSFFELRVLKGISKGGGRVAAERLFDVSHLNYMPWANLFDRRFGLFTYAPVLAVALLGWLPLCRRFPYESGALLAGVVLNFAFACLIGFYGSSYGGRYLVPFIPLLGVGFAGIWLYPLLARRLLLVGFGALLVWSTLINLKGSLAL